MAGGDPGSAGGLVPSSDASEAAAETESTFHVCYCCDSFSCYCGCRSGCLRALGRRFGSSEDGCTALDFAWVVAALLVLLSDVATDVCLALAYYSSEEYSCFALTLGFVLGPSLAVQALSFCWFVRDYGPRPSRRPPGRRCCSVCVWSWQAVIHILQLGQVWRYVRVLYLGVRSQRQKTYPYRRRFQWALMYEYADVSMLRLLEGMLESAPQLVLQLSIMLQHRRVDALQCKYLGISSIASLLSLAIVLAAYHKALRDSRGDKNIMSYRGALLHIAWRSLTIFSRVLSFALFASVFQLYFVIFLVVHWCLMTFWIVTEETDFCASKWEEILFNMLVGVVYIFCWFSVKDGKIPLRMAVFYLIILTENVVLTLSWYFYRDTAVSEASAAMLLIFNFLSFAVGMGVMFLYYAAFHPSGPRLRWVPSSCCATILAGLAMPPPLPQAISAPVVPTVAPCDVEAGARETPVFEVRHVAVPTVTQLQPDGPVIRVGLPRKRYPAWDTHFLDRRLRGTIRLLEYTTPTASIVQYRDVSIRYELYEYETSL
uniref:XK-related protein 6-like isoform X1 n=1 Tax=Myxine glutinosa TaxID=7769 RepID=UPI00358E801E